MLAGKGSLVLVEGSVGTNDTMVDGSVLVMAADTEAAIVARVVFSSGFFCLGIKVVSVCSVVLLVFRFIIEGFKV